MMTTTLLVIIPNIILGLIQIFLVYKLYRTAKALLKEDSDYLKQLMNTCFEFIKKMMERRQ